MTEHTDVGYIKGKPLYMSPEQAGSETLDCRTDVFSLGLVAYELLGLVHFFRARKLHALLESIGEHRDPCERLVRLTTCGLESHALLSQMLQGDRSRRISSAIEVPEAADQLLDELGGRRSTRELAELVESVERKPDADTTVRTSVSTSVSTLIFSGEHSDTLEDEPVAHKAATQYRRISRTLAVAVAVVALFLAGGFLGARWFAPLSAESPSLDVVELDVAAEPAPAPAPDLETQTETIVEPAPSGTLDDAPNPRPRRSARRASSQRRSRNRPSRAVESESDGVAAAAVSPNTASEPVEPATPAEDGTLGFVVDPWAVVFVNGKRLGYTPLTPISVAPGQHRVRLENSETKKVKELSVTVRSGELTRVRETLF